MAQRNTNSYCNKYLEVKAFKKFWHADELLLQDIEKFAFQGGAKMTTVEKNTSKKTLQQALNVYAGV